MVNLSGVFEIRLIFKDRKKLDQDYQLSEL